MSSLIFIRKQLVFSLQVVLIVCVGLRLNLFSLRALCFVRLMSRAIRVLPQATRAKKSAFVCG